MTDPNSIASALFSRRFAAISLSLIAAILAYGLLWQDAGSRLALRVDTLATQLSNQDLTLTIGQKQVRGFPYRLELYLNDVTLSHGASTYHIDELVLYASPLSLDHLVIDSGDRSGGRGDASFVLSLMGGRLQAKDARASLVGLGPDMRIAIDLKSARFQRDGTDEADWIASRLQYHGRPDPQSAARDHVVRIDGLNPLSGIGSRMDLFEVYATRRPDGMTEITDGTWVADSVPQKITGTFSIDAKGVIAGAVTIRPPDGDPATVSLTHPSPWQMDFLKLMVLP
jgi:hypothetical protein